MYPPPKCPYSYFSPVALFSCEYPKTFFKIILVSFQTCHDVYLGLCLVCSFTCLLALLIWTNVYVTSNDYTNSITHTVIFSNKKVKGDGQRVVAQVRMNVRKTMEGETTYELNFVSKHFVRNNQRTHFSFKNSGHTLLSKSKHSCIAINMSVWSKEYKS